MFEFYDKDRNEGLDRKESEDFFFMICKNNIIF